MLPHVLKICVILVGQGIQPIPSAKEPVMVRSDSPRPAYDFSPEEHQLLESVQYAAFQYFWKEVGSPSGLVKDRHLGPVSSVAAVGFQLSSLPIGVERGWITKSQGQSRAEAILKTLLKRTDNKRHGMYIHFPDLNSGGVDSAGYETEASTVDTALLQAGVMTVSVYFGGEVKALADRMIDEANWRAYAVGPDGFISMGWKPEVRTDFNGKGEFIKWHWYNASDEERLVYFLAVGSPNAAHAVDPALYHKLQRTLKSHKDMPPFVASWPGGLFTYFFSHCWINYRSLPMDDPSRFGINQPRVDWFENSRRAVLTHRQRCIEMAGQFKTLAADRWGLSPCAGRDGYLVPSVMPNLSDQDELFEGTVAPYAAVSAIMFTPRESMDAIRAFMNLKDSQGKPLVWHDPKDGGFGFADSFNLDQKFVSDDYVGIDHGPLLLAIENVRTGLIWKLFMDHPVAQSAVERLRLKE